MSILSLIHNFKTKFSFKETPPAELYTYHLDVCFNHLVSGWVYKKDSPQKPVHVAFKVGKHTFCEVMANEPRDDLQAANLPTASCSFRVSPDLPQISLKPTLADLYFDGLKVNSEPIIFAIDYQELLFALQHQLLLIDSSDKNK